MVCTFFGHSDTSYEIKPLLRKIIIDLIEKNNVTTFYVGNNGNFDYLVKNTLEEVKEQFPHINYNIIIAYIPRPAEKDNDYDYSLTIYPESLERVPKRYAIVERNKWMIKQSNFVVVYVKHIIGGAYQFMQLSEKQNKTVINIADLEINYI